MMHDAVFIFFLSHNNSSVKKWTKLESSCQQIRHHKQLKKPTDSGWSPFCDNMAILVKGDHYFFSRRDIQFVEETRLIVCTFWYGMRVNAILLDTMTSCWWLLTAKWSSLIREYNKIATDLKIWPTTDILYFI